MSAFNPHCGEPRALLCYGDSNTYGYNPNTDGDRYPLDVIWTTRLAEALGSSWRVIPEGLNGRTTAYDRPDMPWKNGLTYLKPCLVSHKPITAVTLMLGTNDCNREMGLSPEDIAAGMEKLVVTTLETSMEYQWFVPRIIVIAPAAISGELAGTAFEADLDAESVEKSRRIAPLYRALAEKYGCDFLDCSDLPVSPLDCEHLTEAAHAELARRLAALLADS